MKVSQAEKKIARIQELALEIENDEELRDIDERWSVMAGWIEVDIDNVSLE